MTNSKSHSSDLVEDEESTVLPRTAWKSQLAHLKALLKAKQALDKSEKAAIYK